MKKLNIDSEGLAKLCGFILIIFLVIGMLVVNLSSFAQESEIVGINPLLIFTPKYFLSTVALTAVTLLYLMSNGWDKIQEIFFNKKETGYSNWAKESEFKKELKKIDPTAETSEHAGIPLINNKKGIWVDDGGYHNLIIGSTGSGKTAMLVMPLVNILAKAGESMIVTDPKGEIYEKNANMLKAKGYDIVLLNFRDPQRGNTWNPLMLPYSLYKEGNSDKATELLDDLAKNILYDENSQGQDPFWDNTSADYFAGIALALFEDAKPEEINLNSINLVTTAGEDKYRNTTYIKEYFSTKPQTSPAYINVVSTLMAPSDTKGSILAVFKQKIKLFSSRENLSEMLSQSDFDMKDIGKNKTAVFIVIQDEKKTYHSLVTIFIKQCYETLISVAQDCGGKLPHRTNFILDEFANMPPLKDVTTMVTAARSRAIRFYFIIQNFAQLYQVYGKENGETIKGNCGNIIYLISSELNALEEISKMCGEKKSKEKDKTASTPLITVSDLQRLPMWTTVILRIRQMPFKTVMTPYFELEKKNAWGKIYEPAAYPVREKQPVAVFDIKEFIYDRNENNDANGSSIMPKASSKFNTVPNIPTIDSIQMERQEYDNEISTEDLIAKIDAKIAELEAQEAEKERQLQEMVKKSEVDDIIPITSPIIDDNDERIKEDIIMPAVPEMDRLHNEVKNEGTGQTIINVPELNQIPETQQVQNINYGAIPDVPTQSINYGQIPDSSINVGPIQTINSQTFSAEPTLSDYDNRPVEVPKEFYKPRFISPEVREAQKQVDALNQEKKAKEEKPKYNITDDQFFDDFFSDI